MKPIAFALLLVATVPVNATARYNVALYLARLMVSEAGFSGDRDHRAIVLALKNRAEARDISFAQHMRQYSWPLFRPHTDRAHMIVSLREDGARPPTWPATMEWIQYRSQWLRVVNNARTWLRYSPPNPCTGDPFIEHWASPHITSDRIRATRAVSSRRWIPARCETKNRFFSVDRTRPQWIR